MPNSKLRIAVVSDIHAFDETDGAEPSHMKVSTPETQLSQHPIASLLQLIETNDLHADILLCPGDLADKAKPEPLKYAWNAIHSIGAKLQSPLIAATPGNHDVDSRYAYTKYDAKGMLQALTPPFPLADEVLNDRFWSRHFVIIERDTFRLVVLNSSAYHGGAEGEFEHGRVSEYTLEALSIALQNSEPRPVNILLCHHHPQQHMEINLGDYDVMKNGQLLTDLLGSGVYGRWLIVHGHKHHPKISYAAGNSTSPVVFSAGSLCAALYAELGTRARNQFYRITIDLDDVANYGLVGVVNSWDWAHGAGWMVATERSGLPAVAGFGYRTDPLILANRLRNMFVPPAMPWPDIEQSMMEVKYVTPGDFVELERLLNVRHQLRVVRDNGKAVQLGAIE